MDRTKSRKPGTWARRTLLTLALGFAGQTHEVRGQAVVISVNSLDGNWVRIDSNNDPNDRMRTRIATGTATLTFVPRTASSFSVGHVLWQNISGDGSLQVRGSDGNYYPARLRLADGDLWLRVQHGGAGNEQQWRRAGPSVDGEWVRIAAGNAAADGMRIRVSGGQAEVRFLPPAAPRNLRVGSRLWQNIRDRDKVEILGGDGRYAGGTISLESEDRLLLTGSGGERQLWVRPEVAAGVRAELLRPADSATGITPGGTGAACAASSLLRHAMGLSGVGIDLAWGAGRDSVAERLGLLDYKAPGDRSGFLVTDIERFEVPSLGTVVARVFRDADAPRTWEERRDLTTAALASADVAYRARGFLPADIDAYETPQGIRYAGLWVTNVEGIDWWAGHDLTGAEYDDTVTERHGMGFRLVDVEAYGTPNGTRYAVIWSRSCDNDNWRQWRDMTTEEYQARADSLSPRGYRVVDLESYRTPDGQRYTAIWERVAGPAWAVRSGRTLAEFLNFHRRYSDQGMRLVDFEAYPASGTSSLRYAGVWAENHPRYRYALRTIVDDSVAAFQAEHAIAGMSVVIMQGTGTRGRVIYQRGFGWADSARGREAHAGTIYPTASIAKAIGGTLAARLEARGLIDLTRPTSDFIDSLPAHHTHTLEQLLSKTACLGHYDEATEPPEQDYALQIDVLKHVVDQRAGTRIWDATLLPDCTPGTTYHYSTHGYTYLGAALEAATGKTLAQLLREEVTSYLGLHTMRRAYAGGPRTYHHAEAYRYDTLQRRSVIGRHENSAWKILGGGLESSARHLAAFGWEHLTGRIVTDSVRRTRLWGAIAPNPMVWKPAGETRSRLGHDVGLAWNVTTTGNAWHGGITTDAGGGRTELTVLPNRNLVIAIMTNQAKDDRNETYWPEQLRDQLVRIVVANPPPP